MFNRYTPLCYAVLYKAGHTVFRTIRMIFRKRLPYRWELFSHVGKVRPIIVEAFGSDLEGRLLYCFAKYTDEYYVFILLNTCFILPMCSSVKVCVWVFESRNFQMENNITIMVENFYRSSDKSFVRHNKARGVWITKCRDKNVLNSN